MEPIPSIPSIYRNQLAEKSSENNNNNKTRTMKTEKRKCILKAEWQHESYHDMSLCNSSRVCQTCTEGLSPLRSILKLMKSPGHHIGPWA
jgi:hypothetical protein